MLSTFPNYLGEAFNRRKELTAAPQKLIDKNHLRRDGGLISAYSDMKSIHVIKSANCWGDTKRFLS